MKKIIYLFMMTSLTVVSCKKDESYSTIELLTRSPWIITSSVIDPPLVLGDATIYDEYTLWSDCIKDDLWTLNSGGTFFKNEGETKCDPNYYDVWDMGMWALSQDEKSLYEYMMLNSVDFIEYEIIQLSTSEMQLKYYFYSDSVTVHSVTRTYKHP